MTDDGALSTSIDRREDDGRQKLERRRRFSNEAAHRLRAHPNGTAEEPPSRKDAGAENPDDWAAARTDLVDSCAYLAALKLCIGVCDQRGVQLVIGGP